MRQVYPTKSMRYCKGFTIIEIMVALAISLLLLLGVVNIFQASKHSFTLQSGVARLQENARFALHVMERSISMAGLDGAYPPAGLDRHQPLVQANTQDNINQNTTANYNFTTLLGTASDSISVKYASATDCLGNATPVPAGDTTNAAIDFFYINTDTTTLMCLGNGSATAQPLADGIENMQILYGQDTSGGADGGPDGLADNYIPAGSITRWTDDSTGGIASVRIALLVSTANEVNTVIDDSAYQLLNAPTLGPFNDLMVRRVFTRTILLRNYPNSQ